MAEKYFMYCTFCNLPKQAVTYCELPEVCDLRSLQEMCAQSILVCPARSPGPRQGLRPKLHETNDEAAKLSN